MSELEFKVGGVYSGVVDGERVTLIYQQRTPKSTPWWCTGVDGYGLSGDEVTDVRGPLVVLDLDGDIGEIDIPSLVSWLHTAADNAAEFSSFKGQARATIRWIADQIEAQTKPPRPDEPTGLGAVVVDEADEDGYDPPLRWTRTSGRTAEPGAAMWISERGMNRDWAAFRKPVVKHAGWSE